MNKYTYKKKKNSINQSDLYKSTYYSVDSFYKDEYLNNIFLEVKTYVADTNTALIMKSITGTAQDFKLISDKVLVYLKNNYEYLEKESVDKILKMFSDCIFGYYILTPFLEDKDVSDIKVISWNKITLKAKGKRYISDMTFADENDYLDWVKRIVEIQGLGKGKENYLQHTTDRNYKDYYLRIDFQAAELMSTEIPNIHIRKMPKEKYPWQYLMDNNMVDNEGLEYLRDRVKNGYGFLISGRGGSGKSTLLNNLIDEIPFGESILVSQESDELYSNVHPQIQFEHTMTVSTENGEKEYILEDELRLGLLQDIDNFVIGEIKGGEALHVFTTAISTGARFFGTIHSSDARSSVTRLAQCARYVSDYPMETLEEMLTVSPFVLIHMSNFSIDEILEIEGWDSENNKLIFSEIFKKKE